MTLRVCEPLTSENAALVLVDDQIGLMTGVRDISIRKLKHNVMALARTAKALKLPIIVTTTASDSMWGPAFPELVDALAGVVIIDRPWVNTFDCPLDVKVIEAAGRKKLIFASISLEVCAAFPAMTAVARGLDAYVAIDASGTFRETKRQAGLLRMMQAGVIMSDYARLIVRLVGGQGTLASPTPLKTVGSFWPYATTLLDYVHRAMRYQALGPLSNDDSYAVAAYILFERHSSC